MNLPEQNELVTAVVKKIMPYGAFCTLPEYGDMEAFMHISEVAPRWIKNIHEFLSERQKLVVKVHRLDREKGQVDVSLKRVNEQEKKNKLESVKREKRAEKLFAVALKNSKSKKGIEEVKKEIEGAYGELYPLLEELRDKGDGAFEGLELEESFKKELAALVSKYIKKPIVKISRVMKIRCYENNGVEVVRGALEGIPAQYMGSGRYGMEVVSEDYKSANKQMDKMVEEVKGRLMGKDCEFSVEEKE